MGILKSSKPQKDTEKSARRKSAQPDFSKIGPLKPGGGAGFLNFRDGESTTSKSRRKSKKGNASDMDSDDDDEDIGSIVGKAELEEEKEGNTPLSPEDAKYQGELAEGVRQIKVCTPSLPMSFIFSL